MGVQKSFDTIAEMLETRFEDWDGALASLPSWDEPVDKQVQQYISGIKVNLKRVELL